MRTTEDKGGILASIRDRSIEIATTPILEKEFEALQKIFGSDSKKKKRRKVAEPLIGKLDKGKTRRLSVKKIDLKLMESTLITGDLAYGEEVEVMFKEKGYPDSGVKSIRVANQWRKLY